VHSTPAVTAGSAAAVPVEYETPEQLLGSDTLDAMPASPTLPDWAAAAGRPQHGRVYEAALAIATQLHLQWHAASCLKRTRSERPRERGYVFPRELRATAEIDEEGGLLVRRPVGCEYFNAHVSLMMVVLRCNRDVRILHAHNFVLYTVTYVLIPMADDDRDAFVQREVVWWMGCFTRDRSGARGQQPLTPPGVPLSQRPGGTPSPTQLQGPRRTSRGRAPSFGGYMLSPHDKWRRPSRGPRESPRAQLENELPLRYKCKYLQHPHSAMHVKGTDKQVEDRRSTPGVTQAVRSISDLPVRAWGAASTGIQMISHFQRVLSAEQTELPRTDLRTATRRACSLAYAAPARQEMPATLAEMYLLYREGQIASPTLVLLVVPQLLAFHEGDAASTTVVPADVDGGATRGSVVAGGAAANGNADADDEGALATAVGGDIVPVADVEHATSNGPRSFVLLSQTLDYRLRPVALSGLSPHVIYEQYEKRRNSAPARRGRRQRVGAHAENPGDGDNGGGGGDAAGVGGSRTAEDAAAVSTTAAAEAPGGGCRRRKLDTTTAAPPLLPFLTEHPQHKTHHLVRCDPLRVPRVVFPRLPDRDALTDTEHARELYGAFALVVFTSGFGIRHFLLH